MEKTRAQCSGTEPLHFTFLKKMPNHKRSGTGKDKPPPDFPELRHESLEFFRIVPDSRLDWLAEDLEESEAEGVLKHPSLYPWMVQAKGEGRYRLIDGYRRQRLLEKSEGASSRLIECRVLPADLAFREILYFRLRNLPAQRRLALSGLKTCVILKSFQETKIAVPELAHEVLTWFGEKPETRLAGCMLQLASLFEGVRIPESLEGMKTSDLMPLLRFSKKDLPKILELAKTMKPGGNKWRALLKLVDENRRIREVSAAELLEDPELQELLNRPQLQGPVRYRLVKQLLERQRYPGLTRLRGEFESARRALGLPQACNLEVDPYFEEEELCLKIRAGSVRELTETLEKLSPEDVRDEWERLFGLFRS